jgi:hypothetical protein
MLTGNEREVLAKLKLYKALVYAHQTPGTQVAMCRLRDLGRVTFTAPDGAALIVKAVS